MLSFKLVLSLWAWSYSVIFIIIIIIIHYYRNYLGGATCALASSHLASGRWTWPNYFYRGFISYTPRNAHESLFPYIPFHTYFDPCSSVMMICQWSVCWLFSGLVSFSYVSIPLSVLCFISVACLSTEVLSFVLISIFFYVKNSLWVVRFFIVVWVAIFFIVSHLPLHLIFSVT